MQLAQAPHEETRTRDLIHQGPRPISLWIKLAYGIGEVANSLRMTIFGLFAVFFYTTVMGVPGTLVGLATGIGLVWDALIDPVIGYASDRSRSRVGRRHGFMLVGGVTMGLAFWLLFSPPTGLSTLMLVGWFLAANLLVRLSSSAFGVPYQALGAEMCSDYDERTLLTGIRGACALAGSLLGAGLVFPIFFPPNGFGAEARLSASPYSTMALAFGVVLSLTALIATVATFGRGTVRHGDPVEVPGQIAFSKLGSASLNTLRYRSFRALFFSSALIFLALVISNVIAIHFFTLFAGVTESAYLGYLQVALYGGSVLGVPVWIMVSRRVQKHRLYQGMAVSMSAVMLAAFVLVGDGRFFGTGDVRPLLIGQLLAGILSSGFLILPASMVADIVDEDQLRNGSRSEGLFFGIFSLGQQFATGLSVVAIGVLVDHFAGLVPGQAAQAPVTIERVGMLFTLLPAALMLAGAVLMRDYALDRSAVAAIQSALAGGHTAPLGGRWSPVPGGTVRKDSRVRLRPLG